MKTTLLPLVFCILLLLFQASAAQQTYHDPANHFSIDVPPDWVEHQDKNAVFARRKGQKVLAVLAFKNQSMETLVSILSQSWRESDLKKTFEKSFPIHEVPSHLEVWEGGGGIVIYAVLTSGDLSYVVLTEAPPSSSKSDLDEMTKIILSFRVVRAETAPPVQPITPKDPNRTDDPEANDF